LGTYGVERIIGLETLVVNKKLLEEMLKFLIRQDVMDAASYNPRMRLARDSLDCQLTPLLLNSGDVSEHSLINIKKHRDHVHEGEFPYTHSLAALNSIYFNTHSFAALNSIYFDTESGIEMPDESNKPLKAPAQEIKNFWATWNHGLHWELPAMSWPYWKVMSCSIGYIFSGAFRARSINEVAEIISGAYEYKYGLITIKEFEEKPNGWAPFDPVMRFTRKDWMQW
jgi:hypothetical protein